MRHGNSLRDLASCVAVLWFLILLPNELSACSCEWSGPFLRVAHRADLVVRGTVTEYVKGSWDRGAMDIRVIEVLRGRKDLKTVRVQGGSESACVPSVRRFPIGTEWIFALHDSAGVDRMSYFMSICGEFWVRVEKGVVFGSITSPFHGTGAESLGLEQLRVLVGKGLLGLVPDHAPHLGGVVKAAPRGSLDIETERGDPSERNWARVFSTSRTLVIDRKGREHSRSLSVGTPVSIWLQGPLAPYHGTSEEPFPVSSQVVAVIVEESNR